MSKVIEDVREEFPEFWNLPITKSQKSYIKTYFDEVNASLIFERLAESKKGDDLVLVVPKDPTTIPLIIIESLLCLLKLDSLKSPSNFLDNLCVGDNVFVLPFSGGRTMKPGIFDGIEFKNDSKGYRIKELNNDTSTTWYPEKTKWRIKSYTSQECNKRKRSSEVMGEKLEQIMELSPGDLFSIQKSKGLVVTGNKGKLKDEIREITIGGDPIESIFPIADFPNADNPKPLLADPLRREFVLGLVSDADTAVEICFKDTEYKLIIIEGASKVRSSYGSIERLNADDNPRKIICILDSTDEEEINTLKAMGIDSWVWKKTDFTNINIGKLNYNIVDGDFDYHNKLIDQLSHTSSNISKINHTEIERFLDQLSISLRFLTNNTPASDEGGIFLWRLYSYLRFFAQIPVTIKEYERYCFKNNNQLLIDRIDEIEIQIINAFGITFPRDVQNYCNDAVGAIRSLYKLLEDHNPKRNALMKLLEDKTYINTTIVCAKPEFTEILRDNKSISQDIKVCTFNELRWDPRDRVILCGYFSRKFHAKTFLAPFRHIDLIFYDREGSSHNHLLKTHPASTQSSIDSKLRARYLLKPAHTDEEIVADTNNDSDIDELLEAVNQKFGDVIDMKNSYYPNFVPSDDLISAYKVSFDDGTYTLINESHHLSILDRMSNEVYRRGYSELCEDDEVIFADNSRNLFEELLADIKSAKKYSDLEHFSTMWWRSLENYAQYNHLSVNDLSSQMKMVGCKRHPVTIREWLKGDRIGPTKLEITIPAIAKVTKDEGLSNNISQVIDACRKLHSIHIQVGRLLIKRIVNSVIDNEEDFDLDEEAKAKIEIYADQANLKVISKISSDIVAVPSNGIGVLFTNGDQL